VKPAKRVSFILLAGFAACLSHGQAVGRDVADLSQYKIKKERPRIWLTKELLTRLREKANEGDKDWKAIKASADQSVANPVKRRAYDTAISALNAALAYQVTRDKKYAVATIQGLVDLSRQMQTIFSGRSYDRKWNTGKWIGNAFALAYDWVRDAMTDEEVRQIVESPGLATAGEWLTRSYARMKPYGETSRPHVRTNTWIHWAANMGTVWLALHGDTPRADEWGRRAMLAASVWTAYHRKVLRGGISFAAIAYGTSVNRNMFKFCEAVRTATGVDLWQDLGEWPEEVVCRWLYWTGPDWRTINHYGHHKRSFDYNVLNDGQETMMYWLAYHFRGAEAGRLAQRWLRNCSPFARAGGSAFERLLLHRAHESTADLEKLPLCYLSEYRGEVVARSDWGPEATWVSLRCGRTHTGEFFRPDNGHFNICKGSERFTADPGSDEYSWHARGSGFRNTIVIGGKGQLRWRTWYRETGYAKMWQRTPAVLKKKAEIVRQYEESFGKILALEDKGSYVYAAGDFSGAYNVPGNVELARKCTRQMLYLRPNTLVFFDRVGAVEAGVLEWRCHIPTRDQERPWGRKPHKRDVALQNHGFTIKAKKHEMVCRTLLPQEAKVSMAPTNSLNRNKGFAGWQMIQVATDGPVKETCFLHALAILPTGKGRELDASANAAGDKVILRLSVRGKTYEVLFNTKGKCGGSIKAGEAPPVEFTEGIAPERVLINRPGK